MIAKKDIDNVRLIMEKTQRKASTEQEKKRYEGLIQSFDIIAKRYLEEVYSNARLQHSN
jgi:t-SNARE complex subunit (syntaxin)